MTNDEYEIAIALYRVCNQRDDSGLLRIRAKLGELRVSNNEANASVDRLQQIVGEAQAGDWKSAMRQTRDILSDQVKGS